MGFLSIMGNSFGCSASGERLVSAARDGDLQEAKALLEYNPRLARYSTFGVRNSPLHYSAAQGHHEIVSLLLESGVDVNLRNYRGQTALMQACQQGHWEVVQILILFRANIHRADYLNGGTALHFAAINGHTRCIRLVLADYVPSMPEFWNIIQKRSTEGSPIDFEERNDLSRILDRTADGGITALHMAALNGQLESVQLLLDLGADVTQVTVEDGATVDLIGNPFSDVYVTVEDGATIDLIGAGSTPLHYAACGGNAQCCQILIARGASLTAENANGWTPLMVARSWNRNGLEGILSKQPEVQPQLLPSPFLSLPLMSIVKIARECGWTNPNPEPSSHDLCAVCMERNCAVAAEGCGHEFCTRCAVYLCSTNSTSSMAAPSPPGSISCPFCRHGIVSFVKCPGTNPLKEMSRLSLSLSICTAGTSEGPSAAQISMPFCKPEFHCARISPLASSSLRSLACQRFPLAKFNSSLCMGAPDSSAAMAPCNDNRSARNQLGRCSRSRLQPSVSHSESRNRDALVST